MKKIDGGFCATPGFSAWGGNCGIKKNGIKDLALLYCDKDCVAAAVFTKNLVKAAPVYVSMENILDGKARAVVVNSGNANACAPKGIENAKKTCVAGAKALRIPAEDIIVASTGIIGQELPVALIENALPEAAKNLSADGGNSAANSILTTDTHIKEAAVQIDIGGKTVTIGAMAKGSGMIHPNMGTMLGFVSTDASIDGQLLKEVLTECVEKSYNRISVDGDTSTNDMVCIMASGTAENDMIKEKGADYESFKAGLMEVSVTLAKMIAGDGEGAGKLITCTVVNAQDEATACGLAKSVITSMLVKTAIFGRDANWGRVLCALGYAGQPIKPNQVDIYFKSSVGSVLVCQNGEGLVFDEDMALRVLSEKDVIIYVDLKDGLEEATAWGCDLTYDYVKINGDYRS
ncbi:MAG: bifunctional glutamate N-acetyltransferase/amino-acid acetyltransferase ArgJ [Anaerovoracaceae bacterium]|jgi:glutamate N-acetyltransferase/amino-acid N-acetyltransferase